MYRNRRSPDYPCVLIGSMVAVIGSIAYPSVGFAQDTPQQQVDPPVERSLPAGNYLLGVGDYVQVDVFNAPDYSAELRVLAGGIINLPILGPVAVGGMSLEQASAAISTQIAHYVRRPEVSIRVLEARPLQVAIAGEVHRPGSYKIPIDEELGIPTLTQAIDMAGGITQSANIRQIQVQRRQPLAANSAGEPVAATEQDIETVDLWQLLQAGQLEEDFVLQDGDRILIPMATALTPDEVTTLATASFSPDQVTVNVVGEVEAPGAIQVPPNTPLNQAILAAGGFNNRARRGTVNLIRLNPNGTVTEQEVAVDFANGLNNETNPPLRPHDTIVVRRSGISRVGDAVEAIASPFSGVFGILRIFD